MATTSSNLTAGKVAGRGNESKGSKRRAAGLVATAALGLSLVAGGAFGHGRLAARHDAPPANAIPFASDTHVYTMWDFREDHRVVAPVIDFGPVECGAAPCLSAPAFVPDQFTYREDHRAGGTALPISLTERLPFTRPGFHCGVILPPAGQECDQEGPRPGSPALVPDQFTYREDHRADQAAPAWPPDYGTNHGYPRER
jgi:hypothetical protein